MAGFTSNIVSTTIDETFPVAGQDNNSQGFRDNFNVIKDSLAAAKTEIENLENNTPKTDEDSNMNNNTLSSVNLLLSSEQANTTFASGISSDTDVSLTSGHHFKIVPQNDLTLTFIDWTDESNRYNEMRVMVFGDGGSVDRTITFAGRNSGGVVASTVRVDNSSIWSGNTFDVVNSDSEVTINTAYMFRVFSFDQGQNVYVKYEGRFG